MKTSVRFLVGAGCFGLAVGTAYWFVAYENAGTTLLLLMGVAPVIIGGYLFAKGRRRRELDDDPDADPAAAAGQRVGRFAGGSLWPLIMGIGVAIGVEGFVYGLWLLVFGLVLFAWATIGLMQESRG
jgi:hypothetical protein